MMEREEDEPVSPAGRFFLRPEMDQVINCALGLKNSLDVNYLKEHVKSSIMIQHPRFCSLLVRDNQGREHWRRTEVEIDRHVLVPELGGEFDAEGSPEDDEEIVNRYLADLAVSSPLGTDKPLWEFHLLRAQKCCVLRIHHALGDGISLMSLFLSCCRRADRPDEVPSISITASSSNSNSSKAKENKLSRSSRGGCGRLLWKGVLVVWFTIVFVVKFILRSLWVKDEKSAITGGAGVELWPRKLATAKFKLDDMKAVKKAVANADLSNMMKNNNSRSRWGNQFGFLLLPVYYHENVDDPLQYVKRAKAMLDTKKQSFEAHCSYAIGKLAMWVLGPKVATMLNYRILCNTSFTISNIVGPQEEIMVSGIPVTYFRVNSTGLPHALTMHMVSFAGRAEMQILVAKEIIPDPRVLAKCFQDALLELKDAAATSMKD
ncbi:PREDICTED: O-acyltransferase WSD1-like isoform X2 [Nelumbo nucifera]|uniref:O-acyltransferase WSD1-like isoform X2 n=1 Tax=Nelumbo nucifera TaxID=4432 RepID=A0A1U8B3R0_NELNU|nr:PREDICTED: O-acyltransferase WSD1-like isoform X2 [Nelumbo nucifera]